MCVCVVVLVNKEAFRMGGRKCEVGGVAPNDRLRTRCQRASGAQNERLGAIHSLVALMDPQTMCQRALRVQYILS